MASAQQRHRASSSLSYPFPTAACKLIRISNKPDSAQNIGGNRNVASVCTHGTIGGYLQVSFLKTPSRWWRTCRVEIWCADAPLTMQSIRREWGALARKSLSFRWGFQQRHRASSSLSYPFPTAACKLIRISNKPDSAQNIGGNRNVASVCTHGTIGGYLQVSFLKTPSRWWRTCRVEIWCADAPLTMQSIRREWGALARKSLSFRWWRELRPRMVDTSDQFQELKPRGDSDDANR